MDPEGSDSSDKMAEEALFGDISGLIEQAQRQASVAVNSQLVALYWQIGGRIREDVLGGERAAYGLATVKRLAARLTEHSGRGWSKSNLLRMIQFVDVFPDQSIVATVSRQLGWSHFVEIVTLADADEREFYVSHAASERWSVRTLRERIAGQLYTRTITGDGSDEIIAAGPESPEGTRAEPGILFRDPYVLDFLGLPANTPSLSSNPPFSMKSSGSCSSSASVSRSSNARSA